MNTAGPPPPQDPAPGAGEPHGSSNDGGAGNECAHVRRQLERLAVEDELKETERALLWQHVKECPACQRVRDELRRVDQRLKQTLGQLDTAPRFTERLMAVLPAVSPGVAAPAKQRVAVNRESAVFLAGSYMRPETVLHDSGFSGARFLRRFAGVGLCLLCIVLAFGVMWSYTAYKRMRGEDAPALVESVRGQVFRVNAAGEELPLLAGEVLSSKDYFRTGDAAAELELKSEGRPVATVVLGPQSRLRAQNRHAMELLRGRALFRVSRERPRVKQELFTVDAFARARVEVTGTVFSLDLTSVSGRGLLVVVEEGSVRVSNQRLKSVPVSAGEELETESSAVQPQRADLAARHAWLRGPQPQASSALAAVEPAVAAPAAPPPSAPVLPPAARPRIPGLEPAPDLESSVHRLKLCGLSFSESLAALRLFSRTPAEWSAVERAAQAVELDPAFRSALVIQDPLPIRTVLRWLAREANLRLEERPAPEYLRFRPAHAGEALGPCEHGALDLELQRRMKEELPAVPSGAEPVSLDERICTLSQALGRPVVILDPLLRARGAPPGRKPGEARTAGAELAALQAHLGARTIAFDQALWLTSAAQAERHTRVERALPLPVAVAPLSAAPGDPEARLLTDLLGELKYPDGLAGDTEPRLAGTPLRAPGRLDVLPGGGALWRTSTGVLGAETLASALRSLDAGTPPPPDPLELLSARVQPGVLQNVDELIAQAQRIGVRVEKRVALPVFARQAFVHRGLPLGEALEAAALLTGTGLRSEQGVWCYDTFEACYGNPERQVVALAHDPAGRAHAAALRLAELLPQWSGGALQPGTVGVLRERIVFTGTRRELLLAVRGARDLGSALQADPRLDPATWEPAWMLQRRKALAVKLDEGLPPLNGSFAGALRHSALSARLQVPVLVEPLAMQAVQGTPVNLALAGRSVEEVLRELAAAAELSCDISGRAVLLRPKPGVPVRAPAAPPVLPALPSTGERSP